MDSKVSGPALRITLIYAVFASLWIVASDKILGIIAPGAVLLQSLKGLFFVAITGALLYSLMQDELGKRQKSEIESRSQAMLLDQVSDAIISTDMNFVVRTFNAAAERIYGWKAEEVIGKTFSDLVQTEYRNTTREEVLKAFTEHGKWHGEVTQLRKNGERGHFMASTSFIVGDDGKRLGAVTVNRDVTLDRRVLQRLSESEAIFSQAFRSGPVGLAITGMDGRFVEVNPALCELLGYTYDEMLGRTTLELNLIDESSRQKLLEAAIANREHMHQVEVLTRTKQGEPRHVLLSSDQITLQGEPHRLVSIINISARMQAEEALRESEERFRTMVDILPVPVFINRDSRIEYGNPAFVRLIGATSIGDVIGKPPFDLFPPEDHDIIRQRIRSVLETGLPAPTREQRILGLDHSQRLAEAAALRFRDQRGDAIQVVLHDITERKQAEARVLKLNRIYSVLSAINETIVRFRDPADLFNRACDIAVDKGGFMMAWIGLYDAQTRKLQVGGTNSAARDLIHRLIQDIKPETDSSLPLMETLHSGQPMIVNDVVTNKRLKKLRSTAARIGLGSMAAFPLIVSGTVRGSFSLYTREAGYFDDEEVKLLEDLASDISFALEVAELEAQRQDAERKVRESHERFQSTLDHMMEGCQIIDFDWRYYYINDMAADHGRMDREALIGQRMMDAYPGIEQTEMFGELKKCMKTRKPKRLVNEFVYGDGDSRWFELSIQPAQEGIFILSTDITARKKAEDRVQQQANELRQALKEKDDAFSLLNTLMSSAPIGLAFVDQDLRYQQINESLAEINGIGAADHIGCTVEQLLPELAPTVVPMFREIMATRQPKLNLEVSGETPREPGKKRDWLASYYPVISRDDRVLGVGLVVLEITERKRIEEALRQSSKQLNVFIENAPVPIAMVDREMRYLSTSQRWLADFNLGETELLGRSHYEIFPEIPDHWKEIHRRAMSGEILQNDEDPFERLDGTTQWLRWVVKPWYIRPDEVGGIIILSEDITDRKEAKEALNRLNAELEQRVAQRTAQLEARTREMESFSYSVSHDLKAPLRGIDGYSRLLLEDHSSTLDEEGQRFVKTIRQGAQQMNQLIEDLLSYSRLERRELGMVYINPKRVIDSLLVERQHELEGFQVTVDIVCQDIAVDPEGLHMALRNLVDNAIKFTRSVEAPSIEITGRDTARTCTLSVKDNGVGFDMKFHDRIFAIFQRLHRVEDYPGTGIGLAIVRKAMERLGGRVWAESEPGHGATFNLEFPRAT